MKRPTRLLQQAPCERLFFRACGGDGTAIDLNNANFQKGTSTLHVVVGVLGDGIAPGDPVFLVRGDGAIVGETRVPDRV